MAKPTTKFQWASNLVVDPLTGENNRNAPGTTEQQNGFVPAFVYPLRQWVNWLFYIVGLWLDWLDTELEPQVSNNTSDIIMNGTSIGLNSTDIATNASDIATNASDIATNASDIATNVSDIATNASDIATKSTKDSGSMSCKITTSYLTAEITWITTWQKNENVVTITLPQQIGVSNSTSLRIDYNGTQWPSEIIPPSTRHVPFAISSNGNYHLGTIIVPSSTTGQFVFWCPDSSGNLGANNFNVAGNKGILICSFTYNV